jgi:hypothetical protein
MSEVVEGPDVSLNLRHKLFERRISALRFGDIPADISEFCGPLEEPPLALLSFFHGCG